MDVDNNDDDVMEVSVLFNGFNDINDDTENDLLFTPMRLSRCISTGIHGEMVTHVIWPRKLTPKVTNDPSELETALVALLVDTLESIAEANDWLASSSKLFLGLYNTNTSPDAQIIASEINRLKEGDMFGFFVKSQHCGISIYIPPTGDSSIGSTTSAIVSTFPVLIPNEEIYSTADHSEFQMELPNQSVEVAFSSLLNSKEFSQQLEYLNKNAVNEGMNTTYVPQWLLPMLSVHQNSVLRHNEFPIMSKKIRDDVIAWKQNYHMQSFRRCAHWTFMKALLQFHLTVQWGDVSGKIMYKLVLLKVMAVLCNYYDTKMYSSLSVDVVLHMLAKLARRIEKIHNLLTVLDDEYLEKFEVFPNGFEDTYNTIMDEVKQVISKVKAKLDHQIAQVQKDHEENSTLMPLTDLDFEADVHQQIPNLRRYLSDRSAATQANANNVSIIVKSYTRHDIDSLEAPDVELFDTLKDPVDVGIFLCDFENWILYTPNNINIGPERMRSLSFAYTRLAAQHYKNNPLGFSRFILTQTMMLLLMDKIATETHEMFKKHRAGVNPDIFDNLILPQYVDCEIAHNLKKYFFKRSKPELPSLIEEQKVTPDSFSVLFARKNVAMQNVIQSIEQSTKTALAALEEEYAMRRKEVAELRKKLKSMDCEYYSNANGKREHKSSCGSCKLEAKISGIRVPTVEDPLPESRDEQNAVAFELCIPIEIACLRDVLHVVVDLLNEPAKKIRISEKWIAMDVLEEFNVSADSKRVFLGTSVNAKHGRTRTSGVHPDDPFHKCRLRNNRNCILYATIDRVATHIPTNINNQSANKGCTLTVEKGSAYENLQWTLNGVAHTQNQVIARQCECPQSLTLCEFKNFGSLRADGHRLQLRKLYAMIETECLSFETLSVQALIMQTLWEKGPSNPLADQWNESHADFTDPKFAGAMIELIDKFINMQISNWKHPLKLLMTVVIAVRVFEMNEDDDVADRIVQLLVKLRDIAFDWIHKVQTAMHEAPGDAQDDVEKLRTNLVEISIAGALTFFVHFRHRHFDKIFIGSVTNGITAVRFWLEFLVTINDNIVMTDKGSKKQDKIMSSQLSQEMFRRLVQQIAIQLESKVKGIVVDDPTDVFNFVKSQWKRSRDGIFRLKPNEDHPETLIISTTIDSVEHFVQIGILTGEFLVNNLPVSRLPKPITEHPVYRRVFETFIFEVQESYGRFDTKYEYRGSHYSFYSNGGKVIVTERRENDDECEHVPEDIFSEEIPYLLVHNHSHWWCKTKNTIEFRPICFSDANFASSDGIQYELDLNTGRLSHKKTNKVMLDVTSESYKKIVNQLARLESKKYIHIFMDKPRIAKIELVRMNIKFLIDASTEQQSYDLISNEFNGMTVCIEQNCGTLYGLRQGLLLESCTDGKVEQSKLLILPHGNISAKKKNDHEIVEINIGSELRNPPFFIYQVDEICQQLKASNRSYSAWFYLAYLHALTSHGLPEPFTGLSGTERSFQILQSAFVWSPAPYEHYDDEALTILQLIRKLAPSRRIKNNLQSCQWPDFIQAHAAQDGFIYIANRLIADSKRLDGLYSRKNPADDNEKADSSNKEIENELDVNVREYFRCLPYFPNLQLSETFIKHQDVIATHYLHNENDQNLSSVRTIANLYHQQKFVSPKSFSVTDYLTKDDDDLKASLDMDGNEEILDLFSAKSVRSRWLSLYNIARSGQFSREKFALVLGLLAYESTRKDDLKSLLLLQTVAANPTIFEGLDPPAGVNTFYLNDRSFNYKSIEKILEDHLTEPDFGRRYSEMKEIKHTIAVRDYIHKIVTNVRSMWPCDRCDSSIYQHTHPNVNLRDAVVHINKKLRDWRNIERLMDFLGQIDIQVRRLGTSVPSDELSPWCPEKLPFKRFTKFYVDFDAKIVANLSQFDTEVSESKLISTEPARITERDWWCTYNSIASPNDVKHLVDSTMYPRLVLSFVLPQLLLPTQHPDLRSIITAVGVQIVREQRDRRIRIYAQQPEMNVALDKELKNEPHTNWLPFEYPEWLIFEIEQNVTIRPIQIEVAQRMIDPPEIGTKHSVMQLNMGEGKTSIIVPLLATKLANAQQLCQVTVLKSLFATNLKELRQCLGGMLNRRLYTFPCRRDMPISKYAETMLDIYVECRRLKGVVLTLPEYRLSFQLKIYEAPNKSETEGAAESLLQTHKWLNQNVRNILDESDAILQPKYQLIYTLGEQLSLDGGAQRWTVIQALLKQLPVHLYKLWQHFGDEKMEFDSDYARHGKVTGNVTMAFRSDVFTPCRIFNDCVYNRLKLKLIDDILDGVLNFSLGLVHQTKQTLRLLLDEGDVSAKDYNDLLKDLSSAQQTTILILSGFLRFNVLQLVLSKRWRVNYGVNERGPRKMAIPFKAKDVAAEMTEFGHPDVAISLTQLSYYYSGLNETQLRQVFTILESQQNSAEIYSGWINSVPYQLVHESIQSYTGVNLSDPKQRNELVFPLFKHNMRVIDFWLSNLVFPREAKTFEHKLMCTAWDLVSDNLTHTVSGFSGTNDTKNILPLPIKQNDLKKLERTNDNVRNILLRPENSGYYRLPANVRGPQILIKLSKWRIPVLLDAGACMLELNNEQVASQWLNFVDPKYFDATVYFNRNDVLMTVDRNGIRTEFDYSVYRNKLDRCLVYLDDSHTRGTDLKFPLGWKACVTLSGDITRDKTVQACMRMRLLGNGHSIVFFASYEAHVRILERCNLGSDAKPTSRDVLEFISGNSKRFEEENTAHWSAAAYNYTKKLVAHKIHEDCEEADALQQLHLKCRDNEYVTLKDMYGIKESALLTHISKNQFDKLIQAHESNSEIVKMVKSICDGVSKKLSQQAPRLERYTQSFDEEQEKELEHELEEQRQIERPAPATAAVPVFDDRLENLINSGVTSQGFRKMRFEKSILSFHESLLNKPMYSAYRGIASPWSENLYVTSDFVNVVESGNSEEYLRPVWWIAHIIHREGDDIFLLLSSYEANMLLPLFRKSTRSALMSYRPRLSQMHSNLLNQASLEVTGINTHSGNRIEVDDEVQIAMYAGSMYFSSEVEQNAYCGFMGLIPTPRTVQLEVAFEEGIITPNSYVLPENRSHSAAISRCVKKCKFQSNPVELAIKIIEAHHMFIRKESHVSAILEKATKKRID
ncbi:hypothetical protein HA402_007464 [Bradysia odoriphaga]|nr:hypothetical protein HA402_007464 [Bradysia odoriphaga]